MSIDVWSRYVSVKQRVLETKARKKLYLLDVGAGGKGISAFLNSERYESYLLDARGDLFSGAEKAHPIVGDGHRLPFRNGAFDIVVSVDTFEHVPNRTRGKFLEELKRVCRERLILHFPVESNDGIYGGRTYDIEFQKSHKLIFGFDDQSTSEHILSGHPTLEEVKRQFPNAEISGRMNCHVWLKIMLLERRPVQRFLTGLIYYLFWKNEMNKPPYWGITLVLRK